MQNSFSQASTSLPAHETLSELFSQAARGFWSIANQRIKPRYGNDFVKSRLAEAEKELMGICETLSSTKIIDGSLQQRINAVVRTTRTVGQEMGSDRGQNRTWQAAFNLLTEAAFGYNIHSAKSAEDNNGTNAPNRPAETIREKFAFAA